MSDETVSSASLVLKVPGGAGEGLTRDLWIVAAKACLSSIPLASLAFDIGEKFITFAGQREMNAFLKSMAERVEYLSTTVDGLHDRLANSPLYRGITHNALLRISAGEVDRELLSALTNAAFNLSLGDGPHLVKQEIARTLQALTPVQLRVLMIYQRYWSSKLDPEESLALRVAREAIEQDKTSSERGNSHGFALAALVRHWIDYPYVDRTVRELRNLELLEPGFDAGLLSGGPMLDDSKVTELGEALLLAATDPEPPTD